MNDFTDVVRKKCEISNKDPKPMRSIFYVRYFARDAINIGKFLYADAKDGLYLGRKKAVADGVRDVISNSISTVAYNDRETIIFDSLAAAESKGKTRWFIRKSISSGSEWGGYYWRYATPEDIAKYSTLTKP